MSVQLTRITAVHHFFRAEDIDRAVEFYCRALGFDLAWHWGDPMTDATVVRDGLSISFVSDRQACPSGTSAVYCHVAGIEALYRRCLEHGVEFYQKLGQADWGWWDFGVVEPSGNRIGFGEARPAQPL